MPPENKIINVEYIIKRLKRLLKKKYVIKTLLSDPSYRIKLYLVAGLLGEDFLEALDLSKRTE